MKFASLIWLVIPVLILVGCAGSIVPPKHLVDTDFQVPVSEQAVSAQCSDLLLEFLKERHGRRTPLTIERCFSPNLIACTVTRDQNTSCHWNLLLEAEDAQNTRITIRRFIRTKRKCVPLSTGKEEHLFIDFLLRELGHENR